MIEPDSSFPPGKHYILHKKQSQLVLPLQNNAYICIIICSKQITDILMKVFSHYPPKGIWQFLKRERINDSTVHLYSLACILHPRYRCGDCFSLFSLWVLPEPLLGINEISSTLSFWYKLDHPVGARKTNK